MTDVQRKGHNQTADVIATVTDTEITWQLVNLKQDAHIFRVCKKEHRVCILAKIITGAGTVTDTV